MGCDIHTYYEVRGPDGVWRHHDYMAQLGAPEDVRLIFWYDY
jgi:hypothetical protein